MITITNWLHNLTVNVDSWVSPPLSWWLDQWFIYSLDTCPRWHLRRHLSSQWEGWGVAAGQWEASTLLCSSMEAFKICNLRLYQLGRRPLDTLLHRLESHCSVRIMDSWKAWERKLLMTVSDCNVGLIRQWPSGGRQQSPERISYIT